MLLALIITRSHRTLPLDCPSGYARDYISKSGSRSRQTTAPPPKRPQAAKTAKDRERYRGEDQKIKDALKNAGAFDWEQQRIQESKIRIKIKR